MHETMEDFLMSHTWQTNANINVVLLSKLKSSLRHLHEWHNTFVRLCLELEERLSAQGFNLDEDELQRWVIAYTTRPAAGSPTSEVTGTKAEQDYVWALFEWVKLGANAAEAQAELQELNQLGDVENCLLDKKKYLLSIVKAYEQMSKKRVYVSRMNLLCSKWKGMEDCH